VKIANILKPNRKWLIASVIFITACAGAVSTLPPEQIGEEIGEQIVEEVAPEPTEIEESVTFSAG
jgi:hypothetical protein